jgi:hypothetical protein
MKRPDKSDPEYGEHGFTRYLIYMDDIDKYCSWLEEQNEALGKRDNILRALEHGGVDNWEWYGESLDVLDDDGKFK